jgi:SAM-dependent methyltransferase
MKINNIISDNKLDLEQLLGVQQKPVLFPEREELFWDDPYISQQMLRAHLDPTVDAASYKHETIDKTAEWIVEHLGLKAGSRVLDLGCGPGLYCTRLYKHGIDVVGMDFSKNSIDYAIRYAKENGMDIEYIYQNYLDMDYENESDAVLLIYYDLGALTDPERDILLSKVHKALKPGGAFVFDVLTRYNFDQPAGRNWYVSGAGFWRPSAHLVLEQDFHYEQENVVLRHHTVIDESGRISVYRIWDHYYSRESAVRLLQENGYIVRDIFSDLTGRPFEEKAGSMGIVAQRAY